MNKVQKVVSKLAKYSIGKNEYNFKQNKEMFRFLFKRDRYTYAEMLSFKKFYYDMIE